nr:hypothetical protein [Tanacetum cinerariifolium]
MSDSKHSTVTYTSISSDDGSLDVGSLGVSVLGYDGLTMMPEDPYVYVEADIQEPPPPDFIPEPIYPEFMPPEDDELPAEEQPLPAAVSPTADSSCYITESDPEEDLKEEDDEDLEEDPGLSKISIGINEVIFQDDDDDEEESSRDNVDDEEEDKDEDEDEAEEHLAPADSVPPTAYHTTAKMSIPSPPLPTSPTAVGAPLGYRAGMIWLRAKSPSTSHPLPLPPPVILPHTKASMVMIRAAAPSTYILAPRSETPPSGTPPLLPIPLPTSSPHLLLPSTDYRADVLEVTLPPRKRLCIALGPRFEVGECSSAPTGGFRADYGFVGTLDVEIRCDLDREIGYGVTNVWEVPDEIAEEIPATYVAELESEARAFCEAWVQSMDASDMKRSEMRSTAHRGTNSAEDIADSDGSTIEYYIFYDLKKMASMRITIKASLAMTTTTTPITNAYLKALIDQGVVDALEGREADRSRIGDNSHNSGTGIGLMCGRMFLEESDKTKKYVGGLPDMIHRSVMASKPKTMQYTVKFVTKLMDKKICTFAERETKNKRKSEDNSWNNQNQQ